MSVKTIKNTAQCIIIVPGFADDMDGVIVPGAYKKFDEKHLDNDFIRGCVERNELKIVSSSEIKVDPETLVDVKKPDDLSDIKVDDGLEDMTKEELRSLCDDNDVTYAERHNKSKLIELLRNSNI